MTDAPGPGWYPDPYGSGGLRWWDGVRWDESQVTSPAPSRAPYVAPSRRPLSEGTSTSTVWIWLVAVLPLVSSLLLLLLHPQIMFQASSTGDVRISDPLALLGGPMYFLWMGVSWLITVALIVFSWLDYRELTRRGVERPFHWAWSFLGIVYPIGRSIIVRGVTGGRGLAPMWVAIAVYVVSIVIAVVWSISLVAQILGTVTSQVPAGA